MPIHHPKIYNPRSQSTSQTTLPSQITTLHASKQQYTAISDSIRECVNLEVLWLDGNELTNVEVLVPKGHDESEHTMVQEDTTLQQSGTKMSSTAKRRQHNRPPLDSQDHAIGTLRLKELYLHGNKLQTLPHSLAQIKFLRILLLHSNRLRDLDRVMGVIKHFRFLEHLDLFNNPLAEEELYRERVLSGVTSDVLRIFDRGVLASGERDEARRKVREWQKRGSMHALPNKSTTERDSLSPQKRTAKKKSDKVVFGKIMRAKDMKASPPLEEYTATVRELYRESMAAKVRLKMETEEGTDAYGLKTIDDVPQDEWLKNSLRYGGNKRNSNKEDSVETNEGGVPVKLLEQFNLPHVLNKEQREALPRYCEFSTLPAEIVRLFPSLHLDDNLRSFDAFFLTLCERESERCFALIREERLKRPIESPEHIEDEAPPPAKDAKKGAAKPAAKGKAPPAKDAKKGAKNVAPEPVEEDPNKVDLALLSSQGTTWDAMRSDYERYMEERDRQNERKAMQERSSGTQRGDLFAGVQI